MILSKIISGGQNGVDVAALRVAKREGVETGGVMPKGFRTLDGPRPEYAREYGMVDHELASYPPRTRENVEQSNGTLRIAAHMESTGERCTWDAIVRFRKTHFDVWLDPAWLNPSLFARARAVDEEGDGPLIVADPALDALIGPAAAGAWILRKEIRVLNVAGNSERTAPGIERFAERYVERMIRWLRAQA